jgi:hypothetical protein
MAEYRVCEPQLIELYTNCEGLNGSCWLYNLVSGAYYPVAPNSWYAANGKCAYVGSTPGYIQYVCNCTKFYPVSVAYNCRTQTQLTGLDLQVFAESCNYAAEPPELCFPNWTPTVGANVWYKVFWVGGGPPIPSGSQPNAWYSYADDLAVRVDSTTYSYTYYGDNGQLTLRNSSSYSTAAAACAGCIFCPEDC